MSSVVFFSFSFFIVVNVISMNVLELVKIIIINKRNNCLIDLLL